MSELTPLEQIVYETLKADPGAKFCAESVAFAIEGDDYRKSTIKVASRTLQSLFDLGEVDCRHVGGSAFYFVKKDDIAEMRKAVSDMMYAPTTEDEPGEDDEEAEKDDDEYFTGEDGKHYRMLKAGEMIKYGDQYKFNEGWSGTYAASCTMTAEHVGKYRRPVESVPPKPLVLNRYMVEGDKAYRILSEYEKIEEGDEFLDQPEGAWEKSSGNRTSKGRQSPGFKYRRPLKELPFGVGPVEALLKAVGAIS